jgi:hypothetical protein
VIREGYLLQLVDQELLDQVDRVGSMVPLLVLEQLQLQLDLDQLDLSVPAAVDQLDRLQLERV